MNTLKELDRIKNSDEQLLKDLDSIKDRLAQIQAAAGMLGESLIDINSSAAEYMSKAQKEAPNVAFLIEQAAADLYDKLAPICDTLEIKQVTA